MTDQHPITPPPELVRKWLEEWLEAGPEGGQLGISQCIATQAARWGSDQELEACCEWIDQNTGRWDLLAELRAARRSKPSSLKAQALKEMDKLDEMWDVTSIEDESLATIRRALEQLDD